MNTNLPKSEEVEEWLSIQANGNRLKAEKEWLEQFAALLRSMQAHGSPVTDALVAGLDTCGDLARIQDELISNGRHFESALRAIEAMTVERCKQCCEPDASHVDAISTRLSIFAKISALLHRAEVSSSAKHLGDSQPPYRRSGIERRTIARPFTSMNVDAAWRRSGKDRRQP